MDSRQFISVVARESGFDSRQVSAAIESVSAAIARCCGALDTVAIPGFGNFMAEKEDEHIEMDPVSQQRTLMPPQIKVSFRPSVILRKRINQGKQ
ncbi:MAG: HU family DNA-binding protein [Muribaculaceae bacterium]|nr:HU family DNA-binding protein [Muribaculaceae bacterium]